MVFSLISRLVNGVKGGVSAGLQGVADVGSSIVGVVKDLTVNTLKETKEFVVEGFDVPASIVKGAIAGIADIGGEVISGIKGIAHGTVAGVMESGGKQNEAVGGAVSQAVSSAKE